MINVTIGEQNGLIEAFWVDGHADTAPKGKDIVCAAVSAIVQTALLGIVQVAGGPDAEVLQEGKIYWQLGVDLNFREFDEVGYGILRTMQIGLETIARDHPEVVQVFVRKL